jgi:hypothetical protein
MTTIYTASAILISVAAVCGFRTWRKLGEPIRQPVVRIVPEREYTPAPKPAPTIFECYEMQSDGLLVPTGKVMAMSRTESMGKRKKTRKQPRRRQMWDETARGDY